jgi:hypothetical protein
MAGLWTPTAGSPGGGSQMPEIRADVLLSTIGIALALLGPGLFGWRRIDLHDRDRRRPARRGINFDSKESRAAPEWSIRRLDLRFPLEPPIAHNQSITRDT